MIRGHPAQNGGAMLIKTPTRREVTARRRTLAVVIISALALAGGLIGQLSAPEAKAGPPLPQSPFSYFPL